MAASAAPSGSRAVSVAVIGAGAAGVACARRLLECGARCTLFERGTRFGGVWGDEGGVVWPSLTSNLPTCIMQYPDTPFPDTDESLPSFVGQREMGRYIEHCFKTLVAAPYAATGALTTVMSCTVTSVRRIPPDRTACADRSDKEPVSSSASPSWAVAWAPSRCSSEGREGDERGHVGEAEGSGVFDAVVVANGHYSTPHTPVYPGAEAFPGLMMHSCEYSKHSPHEWVGKRVVVVGAKASGTDIARELVAAGASVFVADRACEVTQVLSEPPLVWHPPIQRLLRSGSVVFEDGVIADDVDAVINCTGYSYDFPFLDSSCGVRVTDGCVAPLYKQLFHVEHPSLVFVGLPSVIIPFPLFDFQVTLFSLPIECGGGEGCCYCLLLSLLPQCTIVCLVSTRPSLISCCLAFEH
jgi:thioredoxin reductase